MNRVPVDKKDWVSQLQQQQLVHSSTTIQQFGYSSALSFVCTGKSLPVEGDAIEHEGGGEPVEEHHQGLDPQAEIFPSFSHSHYREDKYANVVQLSLTTGGAIAIQNYSI